MGDKADKNKRKGNSELWRKDYEAKLDVPPTTSVARASTSSRRSTSIARTSRCPSGSRADHVQL